MRSNLMKRVLAAVLILLLVPACTGLAEKVYVMTNTRAYAKPDTDSKSFKLEAGSQVNMVAEKEGWAKIKKSGKVAFVDADSLAEIKTYNGKTMYMVSDAYLLKNFAGTKTLKSLKKGAQVSLLATVDDWAYIKSGSKKGFVKENLLSATKPENENPGKTAYVSVDGAKLFKKKSTSSKVLATLSVNTEVTVLATNGAWSRVKCGADTGFMKKKQLSETKVEVPVEEEFEAAVAVDGAKLYKKCATSSKVKATFKKGDTVTVTAYTSQWCAVTAGKKSGYMKRTDLTTNLPDPEPDPDPNPSLPGDSTATPAKGTAQAMDWWTSNISSIFSVGTVAIVTDVKTGIAWNEKRMGGTNHADVQPVTADDTAAMKKAVGSWSWERRPIFVTINGVNYAASMNCMPHGSDSISGNNFNGHHCIHFTNSRTHGSNKVCALHQAAIAEAVATTLR